MNRIFCILLTLSIIALSLCACGTQGEQSGSSESDNKADTSQQSNEVASTEAPTTEPATEPSYENTNFIAQPPQGKVNYTAKEIFVDNNWRTTHFDAYGDYTVITNNSSYDVIYDSDGNEVVNFGNIAVDKGYRKYGKLYGDIWQDYAIVNLTPTILEDKYFLYNLKTKEMKDIGDYVSLSDSDSAEIDNGIIIINKYDSESSKYGALDLELNEIIPCEYDDLFTASPELLIAEKDNKYGIIDTKNNVVVKFKYKKILPFTGYKSFGSYSKLNSLVDFDKNINKYTVALNEENKYILFDNKGTETPLSYSISEYYKNIEGEDRDATDQGRVVSQYNGVTYIRHYDNKTNVKIISDIDGNNIVNNVNGNGFINGYCTSYDDNTFTNNLIDIKGNIFYQQDLTKIADTISLDIELLKNDSYISSASQSSKTEEEKQNNEKKYFFDYIKSRTEIFPVDQNGLFVVKECDLNSIKDINFNSVSSSEYENINFTYRILDLNLEEIGNYSISECDIDPLGNGLFAKRADNSFSIIKVSAE